jgi:hypothetical protein
MGGETGRVLNTVPDVFKDSGFIPPCYGVIP